MSMSCYSAPFDHPFADSIGEKFIREPNVGAIAVLASSWRNTPNDKFSRYIMDNIFKNPDYSIGEAILAGKRHFKGKEMIQMYNLLGEDNKLQANIETKSFNGKAKIELIDKDSDLLDSIEIDITNPTFNFEFNTIPENCIQGRIYAWDVDRNLDAMASFDCKKPK